MGGLHFYFYQCPLTWRAGWCRGVVVERADSYNAGLASSNPARVTTKLPLARKATGIHRESTLEMV